MTIYEDFLVGAIDLHCHIDLEFSRTALRKREPEWEWLPKAEALGMRGVVLKSHWWPTAPSTTYIKQLYRGPVELWPSIALNPIVGGPELWAVEAAVALGARVVFLPTWGSCKDLDQRGFMHGQISATLGTFDASRIVGVPFVDDTGALTPRARDLVHYCHDNDLTLGTGHVSWQEALAVIEEAHRANYRRVIFTHPFGHVPIEVIQRATQLGAFAEVVWPMVSPGRNNPVHVVEWMHQVGIEQCVIASDTFRTTQPCAPELFRYLVGTLHESGLSAEEVRRAIVVNPARALGLEPAQ
jgi:hypothetical protein